MKHVGARSNAKDVVSQEQIAPFQRYYAQEAEPAGPRLQGDIWLKTTSGDSTAGVLYQWYVGTSSSCWVAWDNADESAAPYLTSGDIEITDYTKGLILRSQNGTRWRVTVNNTGSLVATSL